MDLFEHAVNDGTRKGSTEGELPDHHAAGSPGKNVIFDVLQNERRRRVLRYLDAADGAVYIGELAEILAEYESDDDAYDPRDRKRTYVSLSQTHFPKLDDLDIVEYDSQSKRVRLAPAFEQVSPYLYGYQETPIRWDRVYLAAGLFGVGIGIPGYVWSSTVALIPAMAWVGIPIGISCFLLATHLVLSTEWITGKWFREE